MSCVGGWKGQMEGVFSQSGSTVRDGYKTYHEEVRLLVPVGLYPAGYKFMEAVVNDKDGMVQFTNYGTFDCEYSTHLKLSR